MIGGRVHLSFQHKQDTGQKSVLRTVTMSDLIHRPEVCRLWSVAAEAGRKSFGLLQKGFQTASKGHILLPVIILHQRPPTHSQQRNQLK